MELMYFDGKVRLKGNLPDRFVPVKKPDKDQVLG